MQRNKKTTVSDGLAQKIIGCAGEKRIFPLFSLQIDPSPDSTRFIAHRILPHMVQLFVFGVLFPVGLLFPHE